jgi:hypothetical protein
MSVSSEIILPQIKSLFETLTTNPPKNRFATDIEGGLPEGRVSFCDIYCGVTMR